MTPLIVCLVILSPTVKQDIVVEERVNQASYVIQLDSSKDPCITVKSANQTLWQGIRKHWNPWKIATIDLNDDGKQELLVGLNKTTRRMPYRHYCIFVYALQKKSVTPLWLGSSLGISFSDFQVGAVLDAKSTLCAPRLVVAQKRPDGLRSVGVYRWHKFGFQKEWEKGKWKKLELIQVQNGTIQVRADGKRLDLRRDQ
jgi:hypothetical protein